MNTIPMYVKKLKANQDEDVSIDMQFIIFLIVNLACVLIYSSTAFFVASKSKWQLDVKGWVNIAVNEVSFVIKLIMWVFMVSMYDSN